MKVQKFVLGLMVLALLTCSMPQGPIDGTDTQNVPQLNVITDSSRNQGIYVNEQGEKFDIVSKEGAQEEEVRCVEAIDIVRIDGGTAKKSLGADNPVKALILGIRHDGYPGVWEIYADDSIHPVGKNDVGEKSSMAGDTLEAELLIHGFFGWQYHVLPPFIGPDNNGGYIITGYAENPEGVELGTRWRIKPGSTVAMYWWLAKRNGHFHLSRARIIGQPSENYYKWLKTSDNDLPHWRWRRFFFRFFFNFFSSFRFFFLDSFEHYLTDVLSASYDPVQEAYLVKGHLDGADSDSNDLKEELKDPKDNVEKTEDVGKIDKKDTNVGKAVIKPETGEIVVSSMQNDDPSPSVARYIIDIHEPPGVGVPDTDLILFDSSGTALLADEGASAGLIDTAAAGLTLDSGTYYLRVYTSSQSPQLFIIRALMLEEGEVIPGLDTPTTRPVLSFADPYENANDGPVAANSALLELDTNWVQRYLDSGDDIDWIRLEIP